MWEDYRNDPNLKEIAEHAKSSRNVQEEFWISGNGGAASYAGEGSVVHPGVDVVESILGECASVLGHGVLSDVVVWPGATVAAPLERAIVMRSGQIVRV